MLEVFGAEQAPSPLHGHVKDTSNTILLLLFLPLSKVLKAEEFVQHFSDVLNVLNEEKFKISDLNVLVVAVIITTFFQFLAQPPLLETITTHGVVVRTECALFNTILHLLVSTFALNISN